MPKPTLCRAHHNAARTVHRGARTVVLLVYGSAVLLGAIITLYTIGTTLTHTILATALSALALAAGIYALCLKPKVDRRLRWLTTGTIQCGACRAIAEGRWTPAGKPITPKASPR